MNTRKISLVNYFAYGSGDFLGVGTTALTAAWLLYFYTTFCGLTPIEATFIFATARVLDAVVSPLMGFLTDNFGSTWLGKRFGRRKFFILLGIPCVFSYSLMWVGDMGFWYYLLTYLLFDVVYTMILVPYETLVPEMTDDFKQKTKFSGARISMAQMSAILASFLPGVLLTLFGKDNPVSFFYASLVFSVLCALMLTFVWFFTWERPREEWTEAALRAEEEKKSLSFGQSMNRLFVELSSTLRVRIFRQHLGMYLGGYIAQDVFNAVFTYYVVFVLMQDASMASNLLGTASRRALRGHYDANAQSLTGGSRHAGGDCHADVWICIRSKHATCGGQPYHLVNPELRDADCSGAWIPRFPAFQAKPANA